MRKRILVTGGAGFVGSHLCERLLRAGHAVVCADNYSTGRRENVLRLCDHPSFELRKHDVVDPLQIWVDQIYNLACPASPAHYQEDPVRTVKASVLGALNLLELAHRTGATILQASTSEVYGDPLVHPQPESYFGHVNPTGPRACYDEGKRCAETLFFDYHRRFGVRIKVARIFNTYGPRMLENDGRIVSNFVVQALSGAPLTVYGDGMQTRSFCYIEDLVDGLVRLMDAPLDVVGPVNLGNPNEIKVLDLAHRVVRLTGSRSLIHFRPLPADDPRRRRPDISMAAELLGWKPTTPLEEGLRRTIADFRARLRTPQRVLAAVGLGRAPASVPGAKLLHPLSQERTRAGDERFPALADSLAAGKTGSD
jgi:UDP-glucuronate decarboxylase